MILKVFCENMREPFRHLQCIRCKVFFYTYKWSLKASKYHLCVIYDTLFETLISFPSFDKHWLIDLMSWWTYENNCKIFFHCFLNWWIMLWNFLWVIIEPTKDEPTFHVFYGFYGFLKYDVFHKDKVIRV